MVRAAAAILAVAMSAAALSACGKSAPTSAGTAASAASTSSSTQGTASTPTPSTPDPQSSAPGKSTPSPSTPDTQPSTPGSSTPSPSSPRAGPATPSHPPNSGQRSRAPGLLTKSQAAAIAAGVNLRPKDLPGFTIAASEHKQNTGELRLEHAMLSCVGVLSGHTELAGADSKEFEHADRTGDYGVSSSVSVARTPAIAASGLVVIRDQRARGCLSHYLEQYVGGAPTGASPVRGLSISSEKPLAPGTSGGVVLRVTASVDLGGRLTPIALSFYGFVCGQTQIVLFTTSLPGSFPAKARQQLLALLLARARAHGQCNAARSSNAS